MKPKKTVNAESVENRGECKSCVKRMQHVVLKGV